MVSMLKWFSEVFWTESAWLAPGIKWTDVANGPDKKILYPDTKDFFYLIPLMVIFIYVRLAFEKYIFVPLGLALGAKQKKQRKIQNIPLLESAYQKSPQKKDALALAKQLDMTERQVERWWRIRKNADKPSRLTKFCEHAWKATYHGPNCIFGLYITWDKDYFWDLDKCLIGYPHQGVTNDVWWFYIINIAYTWTSVITLFYEVRRKDFVLMLIHHLLTGVLITGSWMASLFRFGVVLLPLQDCSEALVEVCKGWKALRYESVCQVCFYFFAVMWFYTRMYRFPFQIFYSTTFRALTIVEPFFMGYLFNLMLLALLVLQVYWSFLILGVIYNYFTYGIRHDVRSSSSEVSESHISDDCINKGIKKASVKSNGASSNVVSSNRAGNNGIGSNGPGAAGSNGVNNVISNGKK